MPFWKKKNKLTNTQVNSNFPWSVLLSTIEMTSKCLKLCCGTTSRHNIALAIFRETSTKIDVKTFDDIVKKKQKKQTNKSTAIFHGLYSYRPQKWRQNVQNFAVEPLADISYERATWAFFLVLLACVLAGKVGLCLGNHFWQKRTIKHVTEDTFSDHASNGKGRKTAIASPKVSWGLKVIYKDLEDITRWREQMNFIFEWQNNILRTSE